MGYKRCILRSEINRTVSIRIGIHSVLYDTHTISYDFCTNTIFQAIHIFCPDMLIRIAYRTILITLILRLSLNMMLIGIFSLCYGRIFIYILRCTMKHSHASLIIVISPVRFGLVFNIFADRTEHFGLEKIKPKLYVTKRVGPVRFSLIRLFSRFFSILAKNCRKTQFQ